MAFSACVGLAFLILQFPGSASAGKGVDFRGSVGSISIKHQVGKGTIGASRKVVRFRWRIRSKPKGVTARLVGPKRRFPRLVARKPGYYLIGLKARRRNGKVVRRVFKVALAPPVAPLGLPIDTIDYEKKTISIGDEEFGRVPHLSLRLLLLDRNTLDVSVNDYPGTRESFATIGRRTADAGPSKLAIVVGLGALDVQSKSDVDAFNDNVSTPIGGRPLSQTDLAGPGSKRPFSIVGVPGWTPGAAAVNVSKPWEQDDGEAPSVPGSISGLIQRAPSSGAFGLVFRDYLNFDTKLEPADPGRNTMMVGNMTDSDFLPPGQSGFHIVRITTGGLTDGKAFATNTGSREQDIAGTLAAKAWITDAPLVMIQSIGKPRPSSYAWDAFARAIEDAGGVRSIVNGLDGSTDYAFIGGTTRPDTAIESVNDSASRQKGTLAGLLARAPSGNLRPTIFDPTGQQTAAELPQLAFADPTPWPFRNTPGYKAALAYFAEQLGLNVPDPRQRYTDLSLRFGGDLYTVLKALTFTDGKGFTQSEFDAVKGELLKEFRWVGSTISYFEETRKVLTESTILRKGELDEITETIRSRLPSPDSEVPINALTPWANLFGFLRGEIPGAGIISSSMTVAANVMRGPKGMSSIDRLNSTANSLSADLTKRYADALDTFGLIRSLILTDPRKLETVGTHIANADPGWNWTDAIESRTRKGLTVTGRQTFYGTLLRSSFKTYILPDYGDFPNPSKCRVLGEDEPAEAWFTAIEGFGPGDGVNPDRRVRAIGRIVENDRYGQMKADGVLTAPLFRPIPPDLGPEGLGLYRPAYMARSLDVGYINKWNCVWR